MHAFPEHGKGNQKPLTWTSFKSITWDMFLSLLVIGNLEILPIRLGMLKTAIIAVYLSWYSSFLFQWGFFFFFFIIGSLRSWWGTWPCSVCWNLPRLCFCVSGEYNQPLKTAARSFSHFKFLTSVGLGGISHLFRWKSSDQNLGSTRRFPSEMCFL